MGSSSTSNWNGDLCFCGVTCAKRVSWTRENPGRRFIACKNYDPNSKWRGCKKFKWIDEDVVDWQKEVALQLIDEKDNLIMEAKIMSSKVLKGSMKNLRRQKRS